jgi:hypothetical protein
MSKPSYELFPLQETTDTTGLAERFSDNKDIVGLCRGIYILDNYASSRGYNFSRQDGDALEDLERQLAAHLRAERVLLNKENQKKFVHELYVAKFATEPEL